MAHISDLNTPDATAKHGDRSGASAKHSSQPGQPAPTQSLHQVIEALIPRLTRYARVLTRDLVAADDLVQECLTRALGKMHLWEEGTDLRAWLFTILHHQYVSLTRRQARQRAGNELQKSYRSLDGFAQSDHAARASRSGARSRRTAGRATVGDSARRIGGNAIRRSCIARKPSRRDGPFASFARSGDAARNDRTVSRSPLPSSSHVAGSEPFPAPGTRWRSISGLFRRNPFPPQVHKRYSNENLVSSSR